MKSGSFAQDARGRWYLNLTCDVPNPEPTVAISSIGIDLGLKDFATLSTGEKVAPLKSYRTLEVRLATAQRAGRKLTGRRGEPLGRTRRQRMQRIHAQAANRRKDFHHKLSTRLVKQYDTIFIGDVSATTLPKSRFNKSVYDAGWSEFRTQLAYKAVRHQVRFKVIDEVGTSRTCGNCGAQSGPHGPQDLGVREWVCMVCGAQHDRDVNAAHNILARGLSRQADGNVTGTSTYATQESDSPGPLAKRSRKRRMLRTSQLPVATDETPDT